MTIAMSTLMRKVIQVKWSLNSLHINEKSRTSFVKFLNIKFDVKLSKIYPDFTCLSMERIILVEATQWGQALLITRVGTLIVATIYLQLIQNRYLFRSFTVLQCSHQHCVQPVTSDVEVVGYL